MRHTDTRVVTLYTTPGCPDCRALRAWLDQHGVPFEERDLSQPTNMVEAKERFGVRIAPITVVGERHFFGTFDQQLPHLRKALSTGGVDGATHLA